MTTRVGLKIEASSGRNHPDSVKDLNSPACSILFKPSNAPTTAAKHALPARTLFGSARGRVRGRCEFPRVKTHKSQKPLSPSRFRLPGSLERKRKERVGSTSYDL